MFRPLLIALAVSMVACSGHEKLPAAAPPPAHQEWLEQGRQLDAQGQSVRAEQYYLAALQTGAEQELVFALLVETCIKSGRLGSALGYVDARLRLNPDSASLRQLSATLHLALGHDTEAEEDVQALESIKEISTKAHLFLGSYYDKREGGESLALRHFEAYVSQVPAEEVPLWVQAALRRLASNPPSPRSEG